jgi:phosphoglycerol transferase MdoB-like AlkP superfamily enzyme
VYSGIDPLFMYLIPALHSVQYLYFVWLLKRNQAQADEGAPRFGRPVSVVVGSWAAGAILLGLLLFHLLPSALDSALVDARAARLSDLGPTPYFAALFAFVNLHHYFMDFVIWRRENPETQHLRA